jgi:uncharacterized protein
VLITGASSGIGRELARQIAPRAACLVLVARREERLAELEAELKAACPDLRVVLAAADLADIASLDPLLASIEAQAGDIDVLINCAGLGEQQLFHEADEALVRRILDVNVIALTVLTHRLLPGMVERGHGGIMNLGSGAGYAMLPGAATYTGSKYFVHGFTETLRLELAGTGVTVTHVAPGPVHSEFMEAAGIEGVRNGPPRILWISSEQCAREAIRGFERGQAVVFPGLLYRLGMHVLRFIPRTLLRWGFEPMARDVRELRRR